MYIICITSVSSGTACTRTRRVLARKKIRVVLQNMTAANNLSFPSTIIISVTFSDSDTGKCVHGQNLKKNHIVVKPTRCSEFKNTRFIPLASSNR